MNKRTKCRFAEIVRSYAPDKNLDETKKVTGQVRRTVSKASHPICAKKNKRIKNQLENFFFQYLLLREHLQITIFEKIDSLRRYNECIKQHTCANQ